MVVRLRVSASTLLALVICCAIFAIIDAGVTEEKIKVELEPASEVNDNNVQANDDGGLDFSPGDKRAKDPEVVAIAAPKPKFQPTAVDIPPPEGASGPPGNGPAAGTTTTKPADYEFIKSDEKGDSEDGKESQSDTAGTAKSADEASEKKSAEGVVSTPSAEKSKTVENKKSTPTENTKSVPPKESPPKPAEQPEKSEPVKEDPPKPAQEAKKSVPTKESPPKPAEEPKKSEPSKGSPPKPAEGTEKSESMKNSAPKPSEGTKKTEPTKEGAPVEEVKKSKPTKESPPKPAEESKKSEPTKESPPKPAEESKKSEPTKESSPKPTKESKKSKPTKESPAKPAEESKKSKPTKESPPKPVGKTKKSEPAKESSSKPVEEVKKSETTKKSAPKPTKESPSKPVGKTEKSEPAKESSSKPTKQPDSSKNEIAIVEPEKNEDREEATKSHDSAKESKHLKLDPTEPSEGKHKSGFSKKVDAGSHQKGKKSKSTKAPTKEGHDVSQKSSGHGKSSASGSKSSLDSESVHPRQEESQRKTTQNEKTSSEKDIAPVPSTGEETEHSAGKSKNEKQQSSKPDATPARKPEPSEKPPVEVADSRKSEYSRGSVEKEADQPSSKDAGDESSSKAQELHDSGKREKKYPATKPKKSQPSQKRAAGDVELLNLHGDGHHGSVTNQSPKGGKPRDPKRRLPHPRGSSQIHPEIDVLDVKDRRIHGLMSDPNTKKGKPKSAMESEDESESKSKDESESKSKDESESKSKVGSDSKSKDGSDSKSKGGSDSKSKDGSDSKSKDGSDSKSKDGSDSKSKDGSDSKSKDGSDLKSKDGSDSKSKDESDSKSKDESDSKSKDESDSKSKDESDSKSKDESDSKSKDESDSKSKDESDSKSNGGDSNGKGSNNPGGVNGYGDSETSSTVGTDVSQSEDKSVESELVKPGKTGDLNAQKHKSTKNDVSSEADVVKAIPVAESGSQDQTLDGQQSTVGSGMHGSVVVPKKPDVMASVEVNVGSNNVVGNGTASQLHGSNIGGSASNMHGGSKSDVLPATSNGTSEDGGSTNSSLPAGKESADPKCSNGIINKNSCCPKSCKECGGSGCGGRPAGKACCLDFIKSSKRSCDEVGPPCTIVTPTESEPSPVPSSSSASAPPSASTVGSDSEALGDPDPKCANGILSKKFCCPKTCGKCGGTGCGTREGGKACCTDFITSSGRSCDAVGPPCAVNSTTASNASSPNVVPVPAVSVSPSVSVQPSTAASPSSSSVSPSSSASAVIVDPSPNTTSAPSESPTVSISAASPSASSSVAEESDEISTSPEPADGKDSGFVISIIPGNPTDGTVSQNPAPSLSSNALSAIPQSKAGTQANDSELVSVTLGSGNDSSSGSETNSTSALPLAGTNSSSNGTEVISVQLPGAETNDGTPSDTSQVLIGVSAPDPKCTEGILSKNSCCPKSCGECGGDGCSSRLGGKACCTDFISSSERSCDSVGPPCMINTTDTTSNSTSANVAPVASTSVPPSASVLPSTSSSVAASASVSASASPSLAASASLSTSPSVSVSSSVSATASPSVSPTISVTPSSVPPTTKTGSSVIIRPGDGSGTASFSPSPAPGIKGIDVDGPKPIVAPVIGGPFGDLVGGNRDNSSVFAVIMGLVGSLLVLLLIGCLYLAITGGKHASSVTQRSRPPPYNGKRPATGGNATGLDATSGYNPMPMGYADDDIDIRAPPGPDPGNGLFSSDVKLDDPQDNPPAYDVQATGFSDLAPVMEQNDNIAEGNFGAEENLVDNGYNPPENDTYGAVNGFVEQTSGDLGYNAGGNFGATLDTNYDDNDAQGGTGYGDTVDLGYDDGYGPGDTMDDADSASFGQESAGDEGGSRGYDDDDGYGMNPIPPATGLSAAFNPSAFGYNRDNDSYSESASDRAPPVFGKTNSQKVRDQLADIHHQIAQQLSDKHSSQSSRDSRSPPRKIPQVPIPDESPSHSASESRYNADEVVPEQAGPKMSTDPWPFWYNAPRAGPHASVYNPQQRVAHGASLGGPELLASVRDKLMSVPEQPETVELPKDSDGDSSWIARRDSAEESKPKKEVTFRDELQHAPSIADRWPHTKNSSYSSGERYEDEGSTSTRTGSGGSSHRPPLVERFNQGLLRPSSGGSKSASISSAEAPTVPLGPVGSAPYVPADLTKNRFSRRFGHQSTNADPVIPTDVNELRQRREPHVKEVAKRLSAASSGTSLTQSSLQSNIR